MAQVFVSHAHGDEELVRRITALLRDGLNLQGNDFFASSQVGRGVAPAANIRGEILKELATTPSLLVVVTPKSAGSPWVWLEAGNRLGRADKPNPIFAVPSQRHLPLVQPVSDLRCVRLDEEEDLHELVKAVGESLGRPAQTAPEYGVALRDVVELAESTYGPSGERKARAAAWFKAHAAMLFVSAAAVIAIALYSTWLVGQSRTAVDEARRQIGELENQLTNAINDANQAVNEELSRNAAKYLILKGVVTDANRRPVAKARVVASLSSEPPTECVEPDCTWEPTDSAGEFRIDLSKIRAQNGDDIVLLVAAPGFESFTKRVRVDVRAIEVNLPGHLVTLKPLP
jgi:hypothetical protein